MVAVWIPRDADQLMKMVSDKISFAQQKPTSRHCIDDKKVCPSKKTYCSLQHGTKIVEREEIQNNSIAG